jgi:hypothetical protein
VNISNTISARTLISVKTKVTNCVTKETVYFHIFQKKKLVRHHRTKTTYASEQMDLQTGDIPRY